MFKQSTAKVTGGQENVFLLAEVQEASQTLSLTRPRQSTVCLQKDREEEHTLASSAHACSLYLSPDSQTVQCLHYWKPILTNHKIHECSCFKW